MVLGSFQKSLTYPKSLYYAAAGYGFAYVPKTLWLETVAHWDDASNQWLASLFGLSHERVMPGKTTDEERAWQEYTDRIRRYLEQGSPVQIVKAWEAKVDQGQIVNVGTGMRTYWWEGAAWTSSHYFTAVGWDESEKTIYINDGALGWFGTGRYTKMELDVLKKATRSLPPHLRYVTITFKKRDEAKKQDAEIETLVRERIVKKLKGDPSVYDSVEMWRAHYRHDRFPGFEHGLKALRSFRNDLEPKEFRRILKAQAERQRKPLVVISWIDISVNHFSSLNGVSVEYLEEMGSMKEWEWLSKYRMLYEKLRVSTAKLRSVFKSTEDLDQAVELSKPMLKDMRQTTDEMIGHVERYLGTT